MASGQAAAKGAKPKDRRPCRLRKLTYGKALRARSGKKHGNRSQAQKAMAHIL